MKMITEFQPKAQRKKEEWTPTEAAQRRQMRN
jgi:hypothetical protein